MAETRKLAAILAADGRSATYTHVPASGIASTLSSGVGTHEQAILALASRSRLFFGRARRRGGPSTRGRPFGAAAPAALRSSPPVVRGYHLGNTRALPSSRLVAQIAFISAD